MSSGPIVVANENLSEREALGLTIMAFRPGVEVIIVSPSELAQVIPQYDPVLVICNQLAPLVPTPLPNWVLLPTDESNQAVVSFHGHPLRIEQAHLEQLIEVVDVAVRIQKMT